MNEIRTVTMEHFDDFVSLYDMNKMDTDDSLDDFSKEKDERDLRAPERYIRDGQNPFEFYTETEFKQRFRFSKDSVMHGILPRIKDGLVEMNDRDLPIAPVTQLLVCLRFYATANYQLVNADFKNLSHFTISKVILSVSTLIAALISDVIKMPATEEDQLNNRDKFRRLGADGDNGIGLPEVDGAIDCTHICLSHKNFQNIAGVYRNRKGYFSLNVQAVVGPQMEFLDIVSEWPGSQRDSQIFENSSIYMRYHQRQLTGTLVGDSGYPCLPFLLTPVVNPVTEAQERYNIVQKRTQGIVQRTFGVLKRRFPCLSKGLGTKLLYSTKIVVACAVLHNLSLILDNDLPEDDHFEEEEEFPTEQPHWQPAEGFAVREALIDRLFH